MASVEKPLTLEELVKQFSAKLDGMPLCTFPLQAGDFVKLLEKGGQFGKREVTPRKGDIKSYEAITYVILRGTLELHRSMSVAEILRRPLGADYSESDKNLFYSSCALLQNGQFRGATEIVELLRKGLYVGRVLRKEEAPTESPVYLWKETR